MRMLSDDHDLLHAGSRGCPISHVIVDEVHERSCDTDLLLLMFRDLLARNKAARAATAGGSSVGGGAAVQPLPPPLKLILMSATLEVNTFSKYFGSAGLDVSTLSVAGRTFPVERHYLGVAIEHSGYSCLPSSTPASYYARQDVSHAVISKVYVTNSSHPLHFLLTREH